MIDNRKISLCIPTYNREEMLIESFEKVHDEQMIDEIVISDDHSDRELYFRMEKRLQRYPKVKIFRNDINIDCYRNKMRSLELASNDWCCLWDSDNIFNVDYTYRLCQIKEWDADTIYTPAYAEPHFDFRAFSGLTVTRENVNGWIDEPMFKTMLNACNFFVNRKNYLETWDGGVDPVTSDSEYFSYCWLKSGRKIKVVEGLMYFHRVHEGSHFKNNNHRTNGFDLIVDQKIRSLS